MNQRTGMRWLRAIVLAIAITPATLAHGQAPATGSATTAAAKAPLAKPIPDCLEGSPVKIAQALRSLPATPLEPRSPILARQSDGLFEFRHPPAAARSALFRAAYDRPLQSARGWEMLDAVPEAAKLPGPADTSVDGALIHVTMPSPPKKVVWYSSSFVYVTCDAAKPANVAAWGVTKATVAGVRTPLVATLSLIVLFYAGGVAFVAWLRGRPHPLGGRYPALKVAKPVTFARLLDPVALTSNAVNQASPQKLQALYFTMIVAGIVLYTLLTTGVLSSISLSVLPLLGISAIGAAVAQAQATGKERLSFENWSWLVGKGVLPIDHAGDDVGKWGELMTSGREFDIYKFQTILFSLVVGIALIRDYADISTFTIPEALLGILGLSQIVYIGGALAKPPSIAELNTALDRMRELDTKARRAMETGADTDAAGADQAVTAGATRQTSWAKSTKTLPNIHALVAPQTEQVARMVESMFEVEVLPQRLEPGDLTP